VTQELAVFPQKLTYCELPEHIIISYDDGIDFDRERPGWLEICNARDRGTGEGPEFHFQKDEFQAGLDALTSDEPRFFYALPELFRKEGRNALVRGYDAADPERKPFVFLVNAWGEETEDERLQQQFADSGGYAWKDDGDMHFRVLSFWRAEDAVSVSKAITQMAANKAEFDALLEERERLRQEFNPLAVNEQFEPVTF
jgi:hypothetical protein